MAIELSAFHEGNGWFWLCTSGCNYLIFDIQTMFWGKKILIWKVTLRHKCTVFQQILIKNSTTDISFVLKFEYCDQSQVLPDLKHRAVIIFPPDCVDSAVLVPRLHSALFHYYGNSHLRSTWPSLADDTGDGIICPLTGKLWISYKLRINNFWKHCERSASSK